MKEVALSSSEGLEVMHLIREGLQEGNGRNNGSWDVMGQSLSSVRRLCDSICPFPTSGSMTKYDQSTRFPGYGPPQLRKSPAAIAMQVGLLEIVILIISSRKSQMQGYLQVNANWCVKSYHFAAFCIMLIMLCHQHFVS